MAFRPASSYLWFSHKFFISFLAHLYDVIKKPKTFQTLKQFREIEVKLISANSSGNYSSHSI